MERSDIWTATWISLSLSLGRPDDRLRPDPVAQSGYQAATRLACEIGRHWFRWEFQN